MVHGQPVPVILARVFDMYLIALGGMPEIKLERSLDPACGVGLNAQGCGVVPQLWFAGEDTATAQQVSYYDRLAMKSPQKMKVMVRYMQGGDKGVLRIVSHCLNSAVGKNA